MKIYNIARSLLGFQPLIYGGTLFMVIFYLQFNFDWSFILFIPIILLFTTFLISLFSEKQEISNTILIFNISFCVYLTFMLITDLTYVTDPTETFFWAYDSLHFWERMTFFSQHEKYIGPHFFDFTQSAVKNGTGMDYMGWLFGRISYALGGNNPLVFHKLIIVWCTALINIFIYKSARHFFNPNTSIILTLTYAVFSYNFIYSAVLLRDMQVALIFAIGIYIILGRFKLLNLLILFLMAALAWIFRPAHGLFYLFFILVYIYNPYTIKTKLQNILYVILLLIVMIPILIFQSSSGYAEIVDEKSGRYSERMESQAIESQGLSGYIYKNVPAELYFIPRIIQTQFNPFSFYHKSFFTIDADFKNKGQTQYLTFPKGISDFFWFVTMWIVVFGLTKKDIRKLIPKNLKFVMYISFALILISAFVANDIRRILGVFPGLFLLSCYILSILEPHQRRRLVNRAVLFFLLLATPFALIDLL